MLCSMMVLRSKWMVLSGNTSSWNLYYFSKCLMVLRSKWMVISILMLCCKLHKWRKWLWLFSLEPHRGVHMNNEHHIHKLMGDIHMHILGNGKHSVVC
jgi:hypothetical protein